MFLNFNWTVTSNFINGSKYYRVYRNLRAGEPDNSGNREYNGGMFNAKEEAQKYADELNTLTI